MNLDNQNQQLIIAGLTGMVDDEGLTLHEALEVLEDIKRNIAPALMQIASERKNG